ncbi:alpha/beta hydrolase [Labilithrix luteola]|nr:alpha/beta hydrolase [Labilithrix luteola]
MIAAELRPIVEHLPPRRPNADVAETRRAFRSLVAKSERPDPRIRTENFVANGVPITCFRPAEPRSAKRPIVVFMHGGGFVYGSAADASLSAASLVPELDATIISVEYRLAPEHLFPAGVEDCYAALVWTAANAEALGCDPSRLAVMGPSAGGCLAAATALLARDRGGPAIAFQCLQIPALDDRRTSHSARTVEDPRLIDAAAARATWDRYLGADRTNVSPYAAPLRAENLSGLPPAYIQTCEFDPYRDDGLDYARRLIEAGVSTELYNVPGSFHAFELFAPESTLARDTRAHWMAAMQRALG